MRKGIVSCFVLFCFALLSASGCAKKEMVKADEASSTAAVTPAKPASQPVQPPVKEAAIQEQQIKEAPLKEEGVKETRQVAPPLEKIYFDFDSYLLSQASRDILYKNAEWLLKNASAKVQIEGHCDERGSDEYNLALGEKRANSALKYLTTLGVPADRLSVISYGKEKPAEQGHDEATWTKNRRDEFIITGK